jgi:hypothetical protein
MSNQMKETEVKKIALIAALLMSIATSAHAAPFWTTISDNIEILKVGNGAELIRVYSQSIGVAAVVQAPAGTSRVGAPNVFCSNSNDMIPGYKVMRFTTGALAIRDLPGSQTAPEVVFITNRAVSDMCRV